MMTAECIAIEVLLIFAGLINKEQQAAYIIIVQVSYILHAVEIGFQDATLTTIGNLIGENKVRLAWTSFKIIVVTNILFKVDKIG